MSVITSVEILDFIELKIVVFDFIRVIPFYIWAFCSLFCYLILMVAIWPRPPSAESVDRLVKEKFDAVFRGHQLQMKEEMEQLRIAVRRTNYIKAIDDLDANFKSMRRIFPLQDVDVSDESKIAQYLERTAPLVRFLSDLEMNKILCLDEISQDENLQDRFYRLAENQANSITSVKLSPQRHAVVRRIIAYQNARSKLERARKILYNPFEKTEKFL